MRSATFSRLSPSSTEAMASPKGTVAVEPSSRGKFSRVNTKVSPGVGVGVAAGPDELRPPWGVQAHSSTSTSKTGVSFFMQVPPYWPHSTTARPKKRAYPATFRYKS